MVALEKIWHVRILFLMVFLRQRTCYSRLIMKGCILLGGWLALSWDSGHEWLCRKCSDGGGQWLWNLNWKDVRGAGLRRKCRLGSKELGWWKRSRILFNWSTWQVKNNQTISNNHWYPGLAYLRLFLTWIVSRRWTAFSTGRTALRLLPWIFRRSGWLPWSTSSSTTRGRLGAVNSQSDALCTGSAKISSSAIWASS